LRCCISSDERADWRILQAQRWWSKERSSKSEHYSFRTGCGFKEILLRTLLLSIFGKD